MLLTVFVDLIIAVGLGVFISNILIIERLSREQARQVKSISDGSIVSVWRYPADGQRTSTADTANGKVLFFYLSGPMIFSVQGDIRVSTQASLIAKRWSYDLDGCQWLMWRSASQVRKRKSKMPSMLNEVYLLCPNENTRQQLEKF